MFLFTKHWGAGLATAAAMLIVLFPAVAHADPPDPLWGAPPCQGSSCIGLDPQATHCSEFNRESNPIRDEETISSPATTDHAITLRYSPWCNASWVRFNKPRTPYQNYVPAYYGAETADGRQTERDPYYYTSMLNGDLPARACIDANTNSYCGQW